MMQELKAENRVDENGNPAGGGVEGIGIKIEWQNGPLGRGEDRKAQNGAFVEGVIAAALQRLKHYQDSKFKCVENELAIMNLEAALMCLNERTRRRELQGTEGTHSV